MSIYRTIARLAAVTSLNNFMQEPWPTLAGQYIFDSKIEPVEDMKHDIMFPCVVIYTDYDKDHWKKAGRVHEERVMSLTLELLVVQSIQDKDEQSKPIYKLECPMTDSEIESALDTLESQAFRALTLGTVSSDAFNYICPTYHNTISRRGASVEGGLRLAARQITLEMKALREPMTGVIPPIIEAFLERLESFDDYKDRVPDIRAILTEDASETANTAAMRLLGTTRPLANLLGAPSGAVPVLPPNIVYHHVELP